MAPRAFFARTGRFFKRQTPQRTGPPRFRRARLPTTRVAATRAVRRVVPVESILPRAPRIIPGICPAKLPVSFSSCNKLLFTSGTSKTLAIIQLEPNNLLDLFGDGSSTVQPLGWDQWNAFFLRYRAQKITLTFDWSKEISAAAHNLSAIVGYHITQQTGDIADTDTFQAICDLPRTSWKYMPGSDDTAATQRVKQTLTINPMEIFKATDVRNFDTQTSTAPVNRVFLQLFVGDASNAALTNTTTFVACLVTIKVEGFFHDRLQLPISVI